MARLIYSLDAIDRTFFFVKLRPVQELGRVMPFQSFEGLSYTRQRQSQCVPTKRSNVQQMVTAIARNRGSRFVRSSELCLISIKRGNNLEAVLILLEGIPSFRDNIRNDITSYV